MPKYSNSVYSEIFLPSVNYITKNFLITDKHKTGVLITDEPKTGLMQIYKTLKKSIIDESIYHVYSFSFFNTILNYFQINLNFPEIKLNLLSWFAILYAFHLLDKKSFLGNNSLYFFLYILFIISYAIILLFWAAQNNLINPDYSIEVSWSRHLGVLINALLIFYILQIFKNIFKYKKILIFIIIFLVIFSPTRILRGIVPLSLENKNNYWNESQLRRYKIKSLADNLLKIMNSDDLLVTDFEDSYFHVILSYELISTLLLSADNLRSLNFYIQQGFISKRPINNIFYISDGRWKYKDNKKFLFFKKIGNHNLYKLKI
jgi:hypothetical protein